jgi:tetratricopeptide (TPR) repeat protein
VSTPANSRARETVAATAVVIRWELNTPARRARLLCFAASAILIYVALVGLGYAAKVLAASLSPERVALAARLNPLNATYEHILGRIAAFERQDFQDAARHYARAARLNPYSTRYWLDLANTQQLLGLPGDARHSLGQALAADPTNPQIANEAANYYLLMGDTPKTLSLLGMVVQHSPADAHKAIELSWRATQDPQLVLDQVLPQNVESRLMLMNILMEHRETAATAGVWRSMLELKQPVPVDSAFAYVEYLLHEGDVTLAKEAWDQVVRRDSSLRGYATGDNLVVNGGFEEDILNGGFGWRYKSDSHVVLAIDQREAYRGRRSLSIAFDGEPVRDAGVFELIPVKPNAEYHLSAKVRTEGMEGAGGPQLAVFDQYSGAPLFVSPDLVTGATGWRDVEGVFRTGADAKLVAVRVVRIPGTTRIRGKMWLDEMAVFPK